MPKIHEIEQGYNISGGEIFDKIDMESDSEN
jgi:hypothetical protein